MNTLSTRTNCTNRTVAALVALVAALAMAAPAAAAPHVVKGGLYDGRDGLTLQVSASGKKVKRTYLDFRTNCGSFRSIGAVGIPDNLKIRGGKFSFRTFKRFPATGGTEKVTFSGKFSGDGLRVVAKFRQKLTNPAAGYRCDTGNLRMVATTGLIQPTQVGSYKGTNSQGKVVRLQVEDGGTGAVRSFFTDIRVTCPRGRAKNVTAGFIAAKLSGGAFSETVSDPEDRARYEFSGRLSGRTVSGTIAVRAEERYYDDESGEYFNLDCTPVDVTFASKRGG